MLWTEENISYCLLAWDDYDENRTNVHGNESLPISGLYNWANALDGKRMFPRTEEELAQFNLFHINVTGRNLYLLNTFLKTKPINSKLILNVDRAVELWAGSFQYVDHFLDQINKADYIFGVEPLMCDILERALKRKVPCLPHPVATHLLKDLRCAERLNQIMFSLHRYDINFLLSDFIIKELPKTWQTIACGSTGMNKNELMHIFTFIKEQSKFADLMELTSKMYAAYETYTLHSYGRYSAECACLGVPCVGSKIVGSISRCFPELTTDTNDIKAASSLLNKLINDQDFWSHCALEGVDRSEFYSYDNSKKRLIEFLNASQ